MKVIAVAATIALAVGHAAAAPDAHKIILHLRKDNGNCGAGQSPMSVEGVPGVFCVSGQACVANIQGACPGPQAGLPNGAFCDRVKTGVLGCKPSPNPPPPPPPAGCPQGAKPVSVEGVGTFCAYGDICAGKQGSCPGPQDGLPQGSHCAPVQTGVLGCKPGPSIHHKKHHKEAETPEPTEEPEADGDVNEEEGSGFSDDGSEYDEDAGPLTGGENDGTPKESAADGGDAEIIIKVVKSHKSHTKDGNCGAGQSPMSVEGVPGVFCVSGQACVANIQGACPGPQAGLPNGAFCDRVKTGVLGCKPSPNPPQPVGCPQGAKPVSVEGVGTFCAYGDICAGKQGSCPGPQDGLPQGSHCAPVQTGVLGCKPGPNKHHKKHHKKDNGNCGAGQSPMSVEGVPGVFCVSGQACVAEIQGACPGPQAGLPNGASCGRVKTGVLGCKPNPAPAGCPQGAKPVSVEGVGTFCAYGDICAGKQGSCPGPQDGLPQGSHCAPVQTGVLGCKPGASKHHKKHHKQAEMTEALKKPVADASDEEDGSEDSLFDSLFDSEPESEAGSDVDEEQPVADGGEAEIIIKVVKSHKSKSHTKDGNCGAGQSPMSVEGVPGVFCVSGQACVAEIQGACPGPQAGLPNGASCGRVVTGVLGCKPNPSPPATPAPATVAPPSDKCNGKDQSPMSVEGVEGVFCVTGQACVADIDGACPGPQDGLPNGSHCGKVQTGVMGCKPGPKKHKKHHHKH